MRASGACLDVGRRHSRAQPKSMLAAASRDNPGGPDAAADGRPTGGDEPLPRSLASEKTPSVAVFATSRLVDARCVVSIEKPNYIESKGTEYVSFFF